MQKINGYIYDSILYKGSYSEIYRVTQQKTGLQFLLKRYYDNLKAERAQAKLRAELEQLLALNHSALLKPVSLEVDEGRYYLLYENQQGLPASEYLAYAEFQLESFFRVAIAATRALHSLHGCNLLHKSIRTSIFLFEPEQNQCVLLEWGGGVQGYNENYILPNTNICWQENLPYIAPEQTGRVMRTIDARTDLYALGVVFYELLTGRLPFEGKEPFELLHAHIAKKPFPLTNFNPLLPRAINQITLKLLAKNAEDRYQSAAGLLEDLLLCWEQYQENGKIILTELGKKDIKRQLKLPQKLYGRRREIQALLQSLEKMATGSVEFFALKGASGVGKTALINVALKPLLRESGYFLTGKFNELRQPYPLDGWLDAIRKIIPQWLSETNAQIQVWRERINRHLGQEVALLAEYLPELEWVLGERPKNIDCDEAQKNKALQNVMLHLLNLLAQKEHPVVIFLDDMQWADTLSIELLRLLLIDNRPEALLIAVAFRDEGFEANHPLELALQDIEKQGISYRFIELKPLEIESVTDLLCDTLNARPVQVRALAQVIHQKTNGNPYFINELLKDLYERQLLTYNAPQGKWFWDVGQIEKVELYKNVVEFLGNKIQKLSPDTRQALILASFLGASFRLRALALILGKTVEQTASILREAVYEKLLEVYDTAGYRDQESLGLVSYRFAHERIAQAAYDKLGPKEKLKIHAQIGRTLKQAVGAKEGGISIFEALNHLNLGETWLEPNEKKELAQWNYEAGRLAYQNKSYDAAEKYFEKAINSWVYWEEQSNEFRVTLYAAALQNALLCRNYGLVEVLAYELLPYTQNWSQRIPIYECRIASYFAQNKLIQGLALVEQALDELRAFLPQLGKFDSWEALLAKWRSFINDKNIERVLRLPELNYAPAQTAIRLIGMSIIPSFITDTQLFLLRVGQLLFLTYTYGISKEIELILSLYSMAQIILYNDLSAAHKTLHFARTAFGNELQNQLWAKIRLIQLVHIEPWYRLPSELQSELWQVYKKAIEVEDHETAALALNASLLIGLINGSKLTNLERQALDNLEKIRKFGQLRFLKITQLYLQVIRNLRSENCITPHYLRSEDFDEIVEQQRYQEQKDNVALSLLRFFKVWLLNLFFNSNFTHNTFAFEAFDNVRCLAIYPFGVFQFTLLKLQAYASHSQAEREGILRQAQNELKTLEYWASYLPALFVYRLEWIRAEIALCEANLQTAIGRFRKAIALARSAPNLAEKAQLYERLGRVYFAHDKLKKSKKNIYLAYKYYAKWGAKAKCAALGREFYFLRLLKARKEMSRQPTFLKEAISSAQENNEKDYTSNVSNWMDLNAILSASQTLSQALHLKELMERLLRLMMENAGATRCVLLLKAHNEFFIEAEGKIVQAQMELAVGRKRISLEAVEPDGLPLSIINYIAHSQKPIVLNDALTEGDFTNDPYIEVIQPKSILGIPILQQGQILGALYLENSLARGVFTSDRVEILKLLAAQAAISIVNAQFYETLEHKVAERTQALNQALASLQAAQEQLISTEKLAALGQLIASIAHEINTPLGVLNGANANIRSALPQLLQSLPSLYDSLAPEEKVNFLQLLAYRPEPSSRLLSGVEERALRKKLTENLSAMQVVNPSYYAQELIRAGIFEIPNVLQNLLPNSKNRELLLNTAAQVGKTYANLQNMNLAISKMEKIIFALKNYAYHNPSNEPTLINIVENIETILTLYQNQLQGGIELKKNYPENLPSIYARPEELGQVWTNLIHNALHAMNNEGILTIGIEVDNKYVHISFTDSGKGIEPEHLSKIFTPFFTTKSSGEGTGLGLYIVKKIIDKHNGLIRVASKPGETTFTVSLPLS
jgi:predicted ATPase/signal transduction histidine kinase